MRVTREVCLERVQARARRGEADGLGPEAHIDPIPVQTHDSSQTVTVVGDLVVGTVFRGGRWRLGPERA